MSEGRAQAYVTEQEQAATPRTEMNKVAAVPEDDGSANQQRVGFLARYAKWSHDRPVLVFSLVLGVRRCGLTSA